MNHTSFLGDKPIGGSASAPCLPVPASLVRHVTPTLRAGSCARHRARCHHIDTSQYYGPDVVNDLIRETLHPYPENLKLVTKVGARRDEQTRGSRALTGRTAPRRRGQPARAARRAHGPGQPARRRRQGRAGRADGGADRPTMRDLQREGKLDLIGVSNVTLEGLRSAAELTELGEVQNAYSVMDRARAAGGLASADRLRALLPTGLGLRRRPGQARRRSRGGGAGRQARRHGPPRWRWRGCWPGMTG